MSNHHCWDALCRLFEADAAIKERFEVDCFEYPTSLFGAGQESAQPRLKQLAEALKEYLALPRFAGRDLVLVGHSQGGLVIQAYFVLLSEAGQARQLRRIRQAIFIATPNLGSIFLDRTRRLTDRLLKFFTWAFLHPHERLLRALQPEIMEIQKLLLDRVVVTGTASDQAWPVPLQCLYGLKDKIVLGVSAQSFFSPEICTALTAGHMNIVQPRDAKDERYVKLAHALLQPIGHGNVVEVERYETRLQIEPYEGHQGVDVQYGVQRRKVFTDNRAILARAMTISTKNRCRESCVIPYLTNPEGFIRPVPPELVDDLVLKERTRYEMEEREFNFVFTPNPGKTHGVTLEILNGFKRGDRRIHFHLGFSSYYRRLLYALDMTRYLQAGFEITQVPRLYVDDTDEHRCEHIWSAPSLEARQSDQEGVWQWEVQDMRQGAVGLAWDLDR